MSLIEEKSNNSNVSRYYHVENVSNISDAVEWICSVIKSKTVDPMYISLSDLVNRSDEGSGNTQLDAKATYDDIMHELDDKNIDIISVIGRFQEKPVVIGVDLRNTQCFLTARKSKKFDFEAIENKLNLSENGLTLFGIQKRPGRNNTSSQSAAAMQPSKSPKPAIAQVACYCGTGRRNASLAVVRVYKKGTGSIIINGLDINDYFGHETLKSMVCLQLMVKGVPFGGVGHSGMGAYHGEWGFREFTHPSTVLFGKTRGNLPLREHPYTGKAGARKKKLLRLFER